MKEITSFDFDEWMQLAQENPQAFEEKRMEAIQGIIAETNGTTKNRLEGLQWQIDQMCRTSKTPMAACLHISKLMWENVQGEDGLVDTLKQLTGDTPIKEKTVNMANVIQFQAKSSDSSEKTG